MSDKIKYIANIVIVALLLASITIQRDARVLGIDLNAETEPNSSLAQVEQPIETTLNDGTLIINSTSLAKDVIGYGGRTPVKVYIKDDLIQKIELEPNSETPSFLNRVINSGLLEQWQGLTLTQATEKGVDVVSGATYTSVAIAGNVQRAAQYGTNIEAKGDSIFSNIGLKDIIGLIVVLIGVILTIVRPKSKIIINIQLLLNVVVLGFWCGAFLSLTTFTTWIGNGVNLSLSLVSLALLCVVIIMPLFGKKGSYCHLHCPMGSAQELIGLIPMSKLKISPKVTKVLNNLRYYILSALLFVMWLGVGFDLMNYEVFSAFIFSSASTAVIVMAIIFLILSLFITKPYCRFICPTGALITMTQKTK